MSLDEIDQKIIDVLTRYGELNITRLIRLTGIHYRVLLRHLTTLVEKGVIQERRFGRLRLFRITSNTL